MSPAYRALSDFAESIIHDPTRRAPIYFPTEVDSRPGMNWRGLAVSVLITLGVVVGMVGLTCQVMSWRGM